MISRFSRYKKEAIEFVKFMHQEENQKTLFEVSGYLPVLESIYGDSSYVAEYPELRFYRRWFRYGVHRPYTENYTRISDILSYYIHLAIRGEWTPAAALKTAQEIISTHQIFGKQ